MFFCSSHFTWFLGVLALFDRFGQTEIGYPQMARGVEQQVAGLQIAMHRLLRVGVGDRRGGLLAEASHTAPIGWSQAVLDATRRR